MYYPVYLDLRGRRCVVIGGGSVAERKVVALLAHDAPVTVVAPDLSDKLKVLARDGTVVHVARSYEHGDLDGARLVFCATDNRDTNAAVFEEAEARGLLVNVVDDPEHCSFIVPSIVTRGDLQIAISTGGASPALAKRVRRQLEAEFGEEYAQLTRLLADFRRHVLAEVEDPGARRRIFDAVADSNLLERLRDGADITVEDLVGEYLRPA